MDYNILILVMFLTYKDWAPHFWKVRSQLRLPSKLPFDPSFAACDYDFGGHRLPNGGDRRMTVDYF